VTDDGDGQPSSPAARNVAEIARIEWEALRGATRAERISVAITNTVGRPACAFLHLLLFATWMTWNGVGPEHARFDPYPFGLLTMVVSMEGVLLAILVLITQNRMTVQSNRREHLDLQVDLLAEQEMTLVLRLLHRIADKLDVGPDAQERDEAARLEHTNIYELMEELHKKLR
jgi:uncharacterized membrane protein